MPRCLIHQVVHAHLVGQRLLHRLVSRQTAPQQPPHTTAAWEGGAGDARQMRRVQVFEASNGIALIFPLIFPCTPSRLFRSASGTRSDGSCNASRMQKSTPDSYNYRAIHRTEPRGSFPGIPHIFARLSYKRKLLIILYYFPPP